MATVTPATELTWFDRSGKKLGVRQMSGSVSELYLAPDQNRVAVRRGDSGSGDIWLLDLLRGTESRFTFDAADETLPVFSPGGNQIAFLRGNDLYVKAATGTGAEEMVQKGAAGPTDWSPDGKFLLYRNNTWDIWALPMTGERKPFVVLGEKFNENRAKFSPDGHWILYSSNETGREEIYVQAFPPSGGKWQISETAEATPIGVAMARKSFLVHQTGE